MADANEMLRTEFNQWAGQGRGELMESYHLSMVQQTIARMALKPGDRVLDLGCGSGWATRLLAQAVEGGMGMAVGLDISDEMIARAREASLSVENVLFVVSSADEIPWRDEYFERAVAIESFYYCPDQEAVLREIFRVLVPGGQVFILGNLYQENPFSLRWAKQLKVPVHARSEREYEAMLRARGFTAIEIAHIPDLSPELEPCCDHLDATADQVREYKRIGALLLVARKPEIV
jgi:ubiquinone/menaquinone biosynthesis C-methylase UbiE